MLDWLLTPIDPTRTHAITGMVAWHARLMVAAWAILLPLGVIAARYFKIMPRQKWPQELDNKTWWIAHLTLQYSGAAALLVAVGLVAHGAQVPAHIHGWLGWGAVVVTIAQLLGGWLRGSKGGPTAPQHDGSLDGDHYSMSHRRLVFERFHKTAGYVGLLAALAALSTGLWLANAPRWMWGMLGAWWLVLGVLAIVLQRRGFAVDTYQAIWGPEPCHPGNRRRPIGWKIRRPLDKV